MASFAAARSAFRSTSARTFASRFTSGAPAARSPFRAASKSRPSFTTFRVPVELSVCVDSMMPRHSVTASALMTSMLAVSQRSYGWLPEDV